MVYRVKSEEERTLRRDLNDLELSRFGKNLPEASYASSLLSTERTTSFYVDVYTGLIIAVISLSLLR